MNNMYTVQKYAHYGNAKITGGAIVSASVLYRQQIIEVLEPCYNMPTRFQRERDPAKITPFKENE